jgi:hypothetical protein
MGHALCSLLASALSDTGRHNPSRKAIDKTHSRRRMEMSRAIRSVLVVVLFLFFAVETVVLADPPTVSIQQQAELIPGLGIFVDVVVNCGDGQTDGTITVGARQGDYADQNVDTVSNAETKQEVTVFIFGPTFVPGEAQASASLACGLLVSGLDLGRTIKIVEQ